MHLQRRHAHRLCCIRVLRRQVTSGASKWQERQRETDRDWERECQVREEREGANGGEEERCQQRQRKVVTAVGDTRQETHHGDILTKEQPSPRHLIRTVFPRTATLRSAPCPSLLSILELPSPHALSLSLSLSFSLSLSPPPLSLSLSPSLSLARALCPSLSLSPL